MQSNFIYIIIAIIIILYTINEINNRYDLYNIIINRKQSILVNVNGHIVNMDLNEVKHHLNIIKNVLKNVSKIPYPQDITTTIMINALIISSLADLEKFKRDNHYIDDENKLSSPNIDEIINNIGHILYIFDNKICRSSISFGNLHNLIKLYSELTSKYIYNTYDDVYDSGIDHAKPGQKYIIDDVNNYHNSYTFDQNSKIKDRIVPIKPRNNNMELSQNPDAGFGIMKYDGESYANDLNSKSFERMHQTVKLNNISNETYESQYRTDSGLTFLIKRDNIPSYIPFCDLSKMREEVENANKHIIDFSAKHSLRNDYNL